jgi:hypothetical protein
MCLYIINVWTVIWTWKNIFLEKEEGHWIILDYAQL